jgi:isochorismate synthase
MNTSTSVSLPTTTTETDIQSFLVAHAAAHDFSLALWRLPNNSARHLILSRKSELIKKDASIEDLPTGFIFSPFDRQKDTLFLKADLSFSFDDGQLKTPETPLENSSASWLGEQRIEGAPAAQFQFRKMTTPLQEPTQAAFTTLVQQAVAQIEAGVAEKIVPSRLKQVPLPEGFDVVDIFQRLCKAYPNALVSLVHAPGHGTWIGATPETLVSVEDGATFKTVALAGTKPYDDSVSLRDVMWNQKEIEEQALVERYIISCFKKIRVREYEERGPKTSVAGNLMHLRSDFTVDMKAINFPQLGSVMLQLLHPTSAVCGMPLEPALEFLRAQEGYDREFYSGYLGPINFHRDIHLFVNLRCMQLFENTAVLYAGAGVTIDSIAEQEWKETEIKLNTMLSVLKP